MKTVALYTKDKILARKIELILKGYARVIPTESFVSAELAIIDKASVDTVLENAYVLPFCEIEGKTVNKPFLHTDLINLVTDLSENDKRFITLIAAEKCCMLGNDKIKLTDVEARLLSVLLEKDGFVTREELLTKVWGDEKTVGVVNVYVHYLREKLEARGEKIIISSRREGYMIDKKYKMGGSVC